MTKPKPKITKSASGWRVELPAFGFATVVLKYGFTSQQAAFDWLVGAKKDTHTAGSFERAVTPRSARADLGWPVVYR